MSTNLRRLAEHILAMENDDYLDGHPEWPEIVTEAKAALSSDEAVKSDADFKVWMELVDHNLIDQVGLETSDLADQMYRDWYEDDMSPEEAAHKALAESDFPVETLPTI